MTQLLNESSNVEPTLERLFSLLRQADYMELMKMFSSPYSEWPAFRAGLIDKNGRILRVPKTQKEKIVLSPLIVFLLDLKKNLQPAYRMANYNSYIQAFNRIQMQDKRVMECVEGAAPGLTTTDIATPQTPLAKTYKIHKRDMKKMLDDLKQTGSISSQNLPKKIKEEVEKDKPHYFYLLDEDKTLIKISLENIRWM